MEITRAVLRRHRGGVLLRLQGARGAALGAQHRCSGWRKPGEAPGSGGAKYRPPEPRVTAEDRRAAAEDKWKTRHIPKSGLIGGRRIDADKLKEGVRGRMVQEGGRSASGSVMEQKFPVAPVYPRTVEEETDSQKQGSRETFQTARRKGMRWVLAGTILSGIIIFVAMDAYVFRSDSYFIPAPYYTMPQYRDRLKITHVVYLDVACNGEELGRIHIGMFHKEAPHFCENFHRLCTGETVDGRTLKGSLFFKNNNTALWGGDVAGIDGRDGLTAFDKPLKPDVNNNLSLPFGCYIGGPFTFKAPEMNDSVFFISLDEQQVTAVGDYTCWGMVLKGWVTVERIAQLPRQPFPYFLDRVEVTGCGVSELAFDEEAIEAQIKAYHKARVRRFLATQKFHAAQYETAQWQIGRQRKLEAKRAQLKEELDQRRVAGD